MSQKLSNEDSGNDLRSPHLRVWLSGCRWALAIGFITVVLAGLHIVKLDSEQAVQITPERINPNTAPLASLMRLPGIGKARASDIIAWRNSHEAPAFKSAASLEDVKGIGPKTSENIAEYLAFEYGE